MTENEEETLPLNEAELKALEAWLKEGDDEFIQEIQKPRPCCQRDYGARVKSRQRK